MPDISPEVRVAVRDAALAGLGDAASDIAQEVREHGAVTQGTLRLILQLAADDALDAAAPVLADTIAARIITHMENHGPKPSERLGAVWRRHFRTCARIAAGAFTPEAPVRQRAGGSQGEDDVHG